MRVRKQDQNGDYVFGHNSSDIWHNQVDGVAQIIKTRLLLFTGEWFLDQTEGMPWGGLPINDLVVLQGRVFGAHTQGTRDLAIKVRVLTTPGVVSILDYASSFDSSIRNFDVSMKVDTIYGALGLSGILGSTAFQLDVTPLDSGVGLG